MRTTSAFIVLLLAGCAAAPHQASLDPEPQRHDIRLAPGIAPLTITDSTRWVTVKSARLRIANGMCQTNDPMPTSRHGPSLPIPNAPTPRPPAYIPNACPVTAGPRANQSFPAGNPRSPKVIPLPHAETPGQP